MPTTELEPLSLVLITTDVLPSEMFTPRPTTSEEPSLPRGTGETRSTLPTDTSRTLRGLSHTGEELELTPTSIDSLPSTRLISGERDSLLPRELTGLLSSMREEPVLPVLELTLPTAEPLLTEELLRRDSVLLRLPIPSP
jgi:hypothetical protein